MTQFLDKFRGRASRVGKQGLLELLNQDFKPITFTQERKASYKNNILGDKTVDRTKSIELNRVESRVENVVLPPIKLDLKQKSKSKFIYHDDKRTLSQRKSVSGVVQIIRQKQQQLLENMKGSPIKRKKSLISPNKNSIGGQVFYDVPDQYQSHQIPEDEMRFLKSFQRYTNSRHFTIHRKMSQGQGLESVESFNK